MENPTVPGPGAADARPLIDNPRSTTSSKIRRIKKRKICPKTTCVKWSMPGLTLAIALCVTIQIGLFTHLYSTLNIGSNPVTKLIIAPSGDGDLIPCVVPSILADEDGPDEDVVSCPTVPESFCPVNYSCSVIAPVSVCYSDDFSCGSTSECAAIMHSLKALAPDDFARVIPLTFPNGSYIVAVALLGGVLFVIIVAVITLFCVHQKMAEPVIAFPLVCAFAGVKILLMSLSMAKYVSAVSPSISNQAKYESANCFKNNANDWFFYFLGISLGSVSTTCVAIVSIEFAGMAILSYFIHGIHRQFWNCNTFVILSVLISISFGVSCFIIFANALNEY